MKANELRIGNWIHDLESDEDSRRHGTDYATVAGVIEDNIEGDGLYVNIRGDKSLGPGYAKLGEYEPIPLTDEWMLKLGFEETWPGQFLAPMTSIQVFRLRIRKCDSGYDFILSSFGPVILITKVHQLQNLYFSLTGVELTAR